MIFLANLANVLSFAVSYALVYALYFFLMCIYPVVARSRKWKNYSENVYPFNLCFGIQETDALRQRNLCELHHDGDDMQANA